METAPGAAQPLAQQVSAAWGGLTPEFLAILEVLPTRRNICLDKRPECIREQGQHGEF